MVQFAYHFPKNVHPRESKIVMVLCILAACAIYPYYIFKTLATSPTYSFEAYAYIFFKTPEIGIVIGMELLWILVVFIRKATMFSGTRYARAMRHFILIFVSPVVLVFVIILAYQGLMAWEIVAHILGSGFMIVAFLFIIVYINSSSEPSTFMVKLIGISLGALLLAVGIGSSITILIKDKAYEEKHLIEAVQAVKSASRNEMTDLPQDIAYILAIPIKDGLPTSTGDIIYARDPQFPNFFKIDNIQKEFGGKSSPFLFDDTTGIKREYRKFDALDAASYYVYYRIESADMIYEVGFDYYRYRSIIHDTGLMLVYVIVGSAIFVITLFPYFFRESLVKPLRQLLDGVKKVNQGNLRVNVPVKVEDEIGFLSKSFNSMVQSIQKARTDLKGALDHQVELTDSYSCFVPKEFLQFLEKDTIVDIHLGDNIQKEMSILFSDIRSFTRLSESMTPQENFNFINNCLSIMGPVVRKHNGFIDKYIGDAIMALFPHRPKDAVMAAISMQNTLKTYNSHRKKTGYEPIQIGIGINTGAMMLGTIGEEKRMEGTVISDTVNLASRLEGLTKIYGASIIVSRNTISGIERQTDFYFRFLDKVQVKGKEKWIEVYEIFDSDPENLIEMKLKTKDDFERGIRFFQKKMFAEALECFRRVVEINNGDKACLLYINRCEQMQQYGIPENWDGVTAIEHK
jgi:class 3 adenylate cyclase/HAMP domain-containing protein